MRHDHLPSVLSFLAFIFGIALLNLLNPSEEVSTLERRELAQFPAITVERLLDGSVARDYSRYLQDQAAFRDEIRFVKSFVERRVFLKAENNGVYVIGERVYDKFYGIQDHLVANVAQRINEIIDEIDVPEVYLGIIPTKAQGLDRDRYLLSDQQEIAGVLEAAVNASYVDLMGLATAGNDSFYYGADPHWTAQGALDAYETLARAMGLDPVLGYRFEEATDAYIGSEYGKAAAWSVPKDTILLAHNEIIDGMSLCRFRTVDDMDCYDSVYVEPTADTVDVYDVYLGGLSPLIVITNEQAQPGGDLVIFKDSYAHAIAPFLAQHYDRVTLVDFRYVQRQFVLDTVDFEGATALFLYSTSVINTDPRIVD
jgi:hypothetical protein